MFPSKICLFFDLLLASEFLVALMLYGLWRICCPGLAIIFDELPLMVAAFFILISTVALAATANMILAVIGLPSVFLLLHYCFNIIKILFPLSVRIGNIFRITRRQIEGSFVAVSNLIFMKSGLKVPAK